MRKTTALHIALLACAALPAADASAAIKTAPVPASLANPAISAGAAATLGPSGSALSLAGGASPSSVLPSLRLSDAVLPNRLKSLHAAWASPEARGAATRAAAAAPTDQPLAGRTLRERLARQAQSLGEGRANDSSGRTAFKSLDVLFSGQRAAAPAVDGLSPAVNDEGIIVGGRAARYYREIRSLVDKYAGRLDLSESLDVMDDSYGDVWAKLKVLETLAAKRSIADHNTHLERTLTWVDGVMDDRGRAVAVHTHRVYYHSAENPRSEIEEGIRRVGKYLDDTAALFSEGGRAEAELGRFDEVVLAFDARGYKEIKDFIRGRERAFRKKYGTRFRFVFLDDIARVPETIEATREELARLVKKYGHQEGLGKIIEGVTYSRYVGLLLELRTIEHFVDGGYSLVQSGRELFDKDGKYVTELDLVVESPDGMVSLVEAKSARVQLPFEEVLKDKVIAKLDTYRAHWKELAEDIGSKIDEVVFSFDVGKNTGLIAYLRGEEKRLREKYGFPVRFLFTQSMPESMSPARRGR